MSGMQILLDEEIRLPLTGRSIPIIADPFVDPAFGSGAVKITPAHDFNDFEVAERHKLPRMNIMTPDGKYQREGALRGPNDGGGAGLSLKGS